MAHEFAMLITQ